MPVEIVKGDLLQADLPAIAHGCNTRGMMGAGIAKPIKDRWPAMYANYRVLCEQGKFQIGDVFTWQEDGDPPKQIIFNLATQREPGADARYAAIQIAVERMLIQCMEMKIDKVGIPWIGCGIGGLERSEVLEILEHLAALYTDTAIIIHEVD